MAAFLLLFFAWLMVMGLDAVRFRWSRVPLWLQVVGGGFLLASYLISYLTFRENTFLAPVVKLQAARRQHVISTGPYARVRHPMYAGVVLLLFGTPLLLGSWFGLAGSTVLVSGIAVRAMLEERTLARELRGYADYMRRVRYRLVPGIW